MLSACGETVTVGVVGEGDHGGAGTVEHPGGMGDDVPLIAATVQ